MARFVLSDPKGSVHGSDGGVTYSYTDVNLNAKTVEFKFEDPVGFWNSNQASASQADWVTWGRTSTGNPGAQTRRITRPLTRSTSAM